MPFSFNFSNTGGSVLATTTIGPLTNVADGVTFSLSGDAAGGTSFFFFENGGPAAGTPLFINDLGSDDQITLAFQSTAIISNTRINGDTSTPINLAWRNVVGSWQVGFKTAGGGITMPTGAQYVITAGEDNQNLTFVGTGITGVVFTSTNGAGISALTLATLSGDAFNCFCAGTKIATPEGEVAVENIAAGDQVVTADGSVSTVKWLGWQDVDVRMGDPRKINPICISAGALGENVPARDLWVSQDHAIGIDGYLVNAGALVNGSTIYQVAQMPLEGFTYYHIETDAHELLLAEGCPAESFIDYASLDAFDNAENRAEQVIPEMPLPRISAARMLPASITSRLAALEKPAAA